MVTGVQLIAIEREKQLKKYDAVHDDKHDDGLLAELAAYVAAPDTAWIPEPKWAEEAADEILQEHGSDPVRCLIIAGALIAAEVDRRLRILGTGGLVQTPQDPQESWDNCNSASERITYINAAVSEFQTWQYHHWLPSTFAEHHRPAMVFADFAGGIYLPWCVSRIHDLEAKLAQYETPGRLMTVAISREGDAGCARAIFHENLSVPDAMQAIANGIAGLIEIANGIGRANDMTEDDVQRLLFEQDEDPAAPPPTDPRDLMPGEDENLLCPPEWQSGSGHFDPAGYDAGDCAACGQRKSQHVRRPVTTEGGDRNASK